jgi:hypothetical protein
VLINTWTWKRITDSSRWKIRQVNDEVYIDWNNGPSNLRGSWTPENGVRQQVAKLPDRLYTAAATAETVRKLKFENLLHSAYSPDLAPSIIIFSECPITRYVDANFLTTKRSSKWYKHGFACNRKHSWQMASGSWWTEETNMWRSEVIASKTDTTFGIAYFL